jgi:hypothetical protein
MMVINHSKQLIILSLVAMLLLHGANQAFKTADHPVISCYAATIASVSPRPNHCIVLH